MRAREAVDDRVDARARLHRLAVQPRQVRKRVGLHLHGAHLHVIGMARAGYEIAQRLRRIRAERADQQFLARIAVVGRQRRTQGQRQQAELQAGIRAHRALQRQVAFERQARFAVGRYGQARAEQGLGVDDQRMLAVDDDVLVVQVAGAQCMCDGGQRAVAAVGADHGGLVVAVARVDEFHEAVIGQADEAQRSRRQLQRGRRRAAQQGVEAGFAGQVARLVDDAARAERKNRGAAALVMRIGNAEARAGQRAEILRRAAGQCGDRVALRSHALQ